MITIAFTGGGTGGHIYPGLAVAAQLKLKTNCRIVWIGSDTGMDGAIVEGAGIEFIGIPSGKLRRYLSLKNISDAFKVASGFIAARSALKKLRPALLFSKGGFVSVPPCAAAASLGIPVFTHESDYSPGLATRINLRSAARVLTAYPDTVSALPEAARARAVVVGNPVRAAFRNGDAAAGRRFLGVGPSDRILLALGGSQGARQVNDLISGALDELTRRFVVVHQTGPSADCVKAERYLPYPYLKEEMADVLAAAELVVGRSGAGTVWEAATAGKPMVLVPLCGSGTRGDQVENAEYFRKIGAAAVLVGAEATSAALAAAVARIGDDPTLYTSMAAASAAAGAVDAAAAAADLVIDFLEGANA